ncbi:hypothetical protein [Liquorilactobacillus hordei]|uniref:hypothetical protein n=1 Tax=Liquorilactobacillus hordei TaxID=468911 RepID=UPI0039E859A5
MSRETAKLERITKFIERNGKIITGVKCTSLRENGFNDMEGTQWVVGIKVFTIEKYRNVQFSWFTNSTCIDDYYLDNNKNPTNKEFKNSVMENIEDHLATIFPMEKCS